MQDYMHEVLWKVPFVGKDHWSLYNPKICLNKKECEKKDS